VSILEVGGDAEYHAATLEVISTCGDSSLGGDDFTEKLYSHIRDQIKYTFAIYPANTYINRQRLMNIAEDVKKELSFLESIPISIPYLQMENGSHKTIELIIVKKDFEEATQGLIDKMETCINKALEYAKLSSRGINKVIVVGGATRMPSVVKKIEQLFGDKICGKIYADIDTAVVEGTTLISSIIRGGTKNVLVLDVLPKSIGIELEDKKYDILIEKNTTIPTKKSKIFTTTRDNQSSISVSLYEGEATKITDNDFLLSFTLDGIPPAAKGVPKIEVNIEVEANGIVLVEVRDVGTGKQKAEKINLYSSLTQREKEKISSNIKDYIEFNKMFNL
jgi:molecular chaperone DnaK